MFREFTGSTLADMLSYLREIVEDETISWDVKYSRVFGFHKSFVRPKLEQYGLDDLDYYDPDTSYEEDTMAYIYALRQIIGE